MLGVHYAVTAQEERSFLAADGDDDAVGDLLEEIEEAGAEDRLEADSDKAWDAIHRCLADGTLQPDGGAYPLSHAVLGGRHLHGQYYVVHLDAAQVRDVAEALGRVVRAWLRKRYDAIDAADYDGTLGDEDFEYTWTNFVDVHEFYVRAAAAGRAVVFTAT